MAVIQKIHRLLKRIGINFPVNRMTMPLLYKLNMPELTKIFRKEIRKGDIVIDIGAHKGYYSYVASDLIGKDGHVYAFEPEPSNAKSFENSIKKENVTLVRKGISNESSKAKLNISKGNHSDHRVQETTEDRESIDIETISLDDYLRDKEYKADFIKMDIQGYEGIALEGMKEVLQRNQKLTLITEYWPIELRRTGKDPIKFIETLEALGFELFTIIDKKVEELDKTKLVNLFEQKEKENPMYCIDILAKRN